MFQSFKVFRKLRKAGGTFWHSVFLSFSLDQFLPLIIVVCWLLSNLNILN